MSHFCVISVKNLFVTIVVVLLLVSICLAGNSLVDNVVETASNNRLLPIYSVETDKKVVALTFDCAWGADDISSIIETLETNEVEATFFTVGDWVKKYSDSVKALGDAGMEIRQPFLFTCPCK